MTCQPKMIVSTQHGCVTQCVDCLCYQVNFNNIIISFSEWEYDSFSKIICNINFDHSCITYFDKSFLVINTCHQDIKLNFTKEEFEEFRDMFQQANVLSQARQVLSY